MRAVIQRVSHASVSVDQKVVSQIGNGLLVLIGISCDDSSADVMTMGKKLISLRIFSDDNGKMNLSIKDIGGEFLVISQFTLLARHKSGNRPSFQDAAKPEIANKLYEELISLLKESGLSVKAGIFGANMSVNLCNQGPVTIIFDTASQGAVK